jgi:pimeloyl-ACP methyl ester carboxylesterase
LSPIIRFFEREERGKIAYAVDGGAVDGRGPFLVFAPWWVSHVERDFLQPGFRALFSRLAEHFTVVRCDRPGVGLSDRDRVSVDLEDDVATLTALLDVIGAERAVLVGGSAGGPPALTFAVRHPARVSHLVLYGSYANGARLATTELQAAMTSLVKASWGLGAKAMTELFAPGLDGKERAAMAELHRASATPEMASQLLALTYGVDVTALLASVRAPTLVIHRRGDRAIPFEHGRELASQIPGAAFAPLEGDAHFPWLGDTESVARSIIDFAAPAVAARASRNQAVALSDVDGVFVRDGDVWTIAFHGKQCHVKHARGLADLALLLARPGRELAAQALLEGVDAIARASLGADDVLDDRAVRDIAARLRTLDDAAAHGDESHERERASLARELNSATGLGGRRRALADPAERARKAVTARIRDSIAKLRPALPELARHLDKSIATGAFCSYSPPEPMRWRT